MKTVTVIAILLLSGCATLDRATPQQVKLQTEQCKAMGLRPSASYRHDLITGEGYVSTVECTPPLE